MTRVLLGVVAAVLVAVLAFGAGRWSAEGPQAVGAMSAADLEGMLAEMRASSALMGEKAQLVTENAELKAKVSDLTARLVEADQRLEAQARAAALQAEQRAPAPEVVKPAAPEPKIDVTRAPVSVGDATPRSLVLGRGSRVRLQPSGQEIEVTTVRPGAVTIQWQGSARTLVPGQTLRVSRTCALGLEASDEMGARFSYTCPDKGAGVDVR